MSASITMTGCVLGALLASQTDYAKLVGVGVFALAYHLFGFAHNNLCDLPFDRMDPNKAHAPLVSGKINETLAKCVILTGIGLTYAFGILLLPQTNAFFYGFGALTIALNFGLLYNRNSKTQWWASLYVAITTASIPAFGFFAMGGDPSNWTLWYVVAYAFLFTFHMNAVMGSLKDAASDLGSWMPKWGVKATLVESKPVAVYDYDVPLRTAIFAWFTRLLCPLLVVWYSWPSVSWPILILIVAYLATFAVFLPSGRWKRSKRLNAYFSGEISAVVLLYLSLAPLLGWWLYALATLPLVWLVFWNRVLWGKGHWLVPKM